MLDRALNHLVREIVDHPDEVSVTLVDTQRGELLEVRVHPEDLGRVIGRSGRTAKALRTVVTPWLMDDASASTSSIPTPNVSGASAPRAQA